MYPAIESVQNDEHLHSKLKIVIHKCDNIDNITQITKRNKSLSNNESDLNPNNKNVKSFKEISESAIIDLFTSKTSKRLRSPKQQLVKTKFNSHTLKLMSSPVTGTVMPRRYTKTPKKSLKRLLSPKIQSATTSRLIKIKPRKLTLMEIDSPAESQKNNILFKNNSLQLKSNVSDTNVSTDCSLLRKKGSNFKVASDTNSRNVSLIGMKYSLRRFLKSPEIVVNASKPKLKLKNSSCISDKKTKETKSTFIKTCNINGTNIAGTVINSINAPMSMKLISIKKALILKEAVVLLKRLPNNSASLTLSPVSSLVRSNVKNQHNDSSKNVSQNVMNSSPDHLENVSNSGNRIHYKSKNSNKHNVETPSALQENTTAYLPEKSLHVSTMHEFENTNKFLEPLMSSTPTDQRSPHEINNKRKIRSYEWDATFELNTHSAFKDQTEVTVGAENEQGKIEKNNETYELIEPKTPMLQKKLQKKRNTDEKDINEKTPKRHFKVRFTLPSVDRSHKDICNEKQQTDNFPDIVSKVNLKRNALKSPLDVFRRRSNSVNSEITSTVNCFTPPAQLHRKSNSFSNVNSVSTSTSIPHINKPDRKYSATKKVPNFDKIHKRMFAKLESIVDAKKRVKDRHMKLTAAKTNSLAGLKINSREENRLSNEPNKDPCNRFGFKTRKRDATECILRNSNVQLIRSKQQQQNRAILKGVRINRRFELQMKSRNINI